mmetsp:Transcript_46574/g.129646  ORF Transcript_46574/g.129646 Transcript_46574/m.129646 type:complete len:210 (-) Transcript_46574:375-1004(-)
MEAGADGENDSKGAAFESGLADAAGVATNGGVDPCNTCDANAGAAFGAKPAGATGFPQPGPVADKVAAWAFGVGTCPMPPGDAANPARAGACEAGAAGDATSSSHCRNIERTCGSMGTPSASAAVTDLLTASLSCAAMPRRISRSKGCKGAAAICFGGGALVGAAAALVCNVPATGAVSGGCLNAGRGANVVPAIAALHGAIACAAGAP